MRLVWVCIVVGFIWRVFDICFCVVVLWWLVCFGLVLGLFVCLLVYCVGVCFLLLICLVLILCCWFVFLVWIFGGLIYFLRMWKLFKFMFVNFGEDKIGK